MAKIDPLLKQLRSTYKLEKDSAILDLLGLACDPDSAAEIFEKFIEHLNNRLLSGDDLVPHVRQLLETWEELYERVKPYQQDPRRIGWMVSPDYQSVRTATEWLLDLFGYLPIDARTSGALLQGIGLSDPILKLFAALSLLRRLEMVESAQIQKIAECHLTRERLWTQLRALNMDFLMPPQYSTHEMLAASEFVRWAGHPMELGIPPEEIELMRKFIELLDGEEREVYLFRFRQADESSERDDDWMAGIAGPYSNGEPLASPWSSFDQWDSMSPEEHYAKLSSARGTC